MQLNTQDTKQDTPSTDRSDLSKLYPSPKTYDELEKVRVEREQARERRKPKHPILQISILLYAILVGLTLTISAIPVLVTLNVISGVFFSFFLVILWGAYTIWIGTRISHILYAFGREARPFLLLYTGFSVALVCLTYPFTAKQGITTLLIAATVIHVIVAYILLKIALRSSTA